MSDNAHAPPVRNLTPHLDPRDPRALLDALDTLRAAADTDALSADAADAVALVDEELTRMHQQRNELRQFLAAAQAAGATVVGITAIREALAG